MTNTLLPFPVFDPTAYPVPWTVDRSDPAHPVVTNSDSHPADFVRLFHEDADGEGRTDLWGEVQPGESLEVCLCAADRDDTVVTVAWFRRVDGLEYVWRFVV